MSNEDNLDAMQNDDIVENSSDFTIPEEYKEKGWTKFFDGKTGDDLKKEFFRSYDNSQTLIGKKVEDYIKNTDLKSLDNYEEIKDYLSKQIGENLDIPENSSDYDLNSILCDENGEKLLSFGDDALNFFGDKFKELGLTKDKAQDLVKSYVKYGIDEFHKLTDANELESELKNMFHETSTEKSSQRKNVESLLKEFLPQEDQKILQDTVPNEVIKMFYKVADGFVSKYGYKENSSPIQKQTNVMTEADKNAEYDRLYDKLRELDNSPHQKVGERDAILKQMREIFK